MISYQPQEIIVEKDRESKVTLYPLELRDTLILFQIGLACSQDSSHTGEL